MSKRRLLGSVFAWGTALWGICGCANFRHLGTDLDALEKATLVKGTVEVREDTGKTVVVVVARIPEDPAEPIDVRQVFNTHKPGPYALRMEPGRYWFGAFEDANNDSRFQDGERGVMTKEFKVVANREMKGPELVIEKPFFRPKDLTERPSITTFRFANGEVLPLDDARFGQEPARKGLWQPLLYARDNQPGIYFLQPYDPARVPVIFVHGMSGYPQEFKSLIKALDKDRLQPWVFAYPSGYELKAIGQLLHDLVSGLTERYALPSLCVVAHSMGGLVARQFLKIHEAERPEHAVKTLVTINSPLGGMPSASWGVRMAPQVVPSWYDIAPGSSFLEELYEKPLSERIEYHMLFAFDDGGESDGVVALLSQLRVEAQAEAEQVRGYRATHVGSLKAEAVTAQVMRALDRCAGKKELSMVATRPAETSVAR
jgi:pimeloyl-ACP methyl ester carboxylesterase